MLLFTGRSEGPTISHPPFKLFLTSAAATPPLFVSWRSRSIDSSAFSGHQNTSKLQIFGVHQKVVETHIGNRREKLSWSRYSWTAKSQCLAQMFDLSDQKQIEKMLLDCTDHAFTTITFLLYCDTICLQVVVKLWTLNFWGTSVWTSARRKTKYLFFECL